jgi:coenzyme F420-reducing hydrogenase beta subunit
MVGTYACQLCQRVLSNVAGQVTGYFQTPEGATMLITRQYDVTHVLALVTPEVTPQNSAGNVLPVHFFAIVTSR